MRIAIVHYHLHPGGVTRVIQHALSSLADHDDVQACVLAGEPPGAPDEFPCPVKVLPSLGYASGTPGKSAEAFADELSEAAGEALGGAPDAWHIHNHSLGKNLGT